MERKTGKAGGIRAPRVSPSSGAIAAGMYLAAPAIARRRVALAINGGRKLSPPPPARHLWPCSATEEREAVNAVVSSPATARSRRLKMRGRSTSKPPYCKSHMNGTSRLGLGPLRTESARQRNPRPNLDPGSASCRCGFGPGAGLRRQPSADAEFRPRGRQAAADEEHPGDRGGPPVWPALRHGGDLRFCQGKGPAHSGRLRFRATLRSTESYVGNWGQIEAFSCQGNQILPAIEGESPTTRPGSITKTGGHLRHYGAGSSQRQQVPRVRRHGLELNCGFIPWARPSPMPIEKLDQQTEMEREQARFAQ